MRRQGVRFPIPSTPNNTSVLNITNFKGLKITKNPFASDPQSANDMKNLYVNEDMVLSTRPRLEKLLEFEGISTDTIIKAIPLSNDRIFIKSNDGTDDIFYMVEDDSISVLSTVSFDIGDKCEVFEDSDKIIFLNGNSILEIVPNTESYIFQELTDIYIPTRYRLSTQYARGAVDEDYNILTNKYKETLQWDGSWDYTRDNSIIEYNKEFYKGVKTPFLSIRNTTGDKVYIADENIQTVRDGSIFKTTYDDIDDIVVYDNTENVYYSLGAFPTVYDKENIVISDDLSTVAIIDDTNLNIYTFNGTGYDLFETKTITSFTVHPQLDGKKVYISEKGKHIAYLSGNYADDPNLKILTLTDSGYLNDYTINCVDIAKNTGLPEDTLSGEIPADYFYAPYAIHYNDSDKVIISVVLMDQNDDLGGFINVKDPIFIFFEDDVKDMIVNVALNRSYEERYVLKGGTGVITMTRSEISIKYNNYDYHTILIDTDTFNTEKIFFENDKLYITNNDNDKIYYYNYEKEFKIEMDIDIEGKIESNIVINNGKITFADSYYFHKISLNFQDNKENIIVTKILDDEEEKTTVEERRTLLLGSHKHQRFMNENWFINGNTMFYSSLSDPLYIPYRNIISLGEKTYPITGINIISDNIMAAYKKNKIYLITQEVINNITGYVFTETKSVAGNIPYDGTIVSKIQELPLHVNSEGIFTLGQGENMATSENVTQSISKMIDPKLDKIDKTSVISLNYKYWTLFIFENYKCFVLDNRSNEWFYWEFKTNIIGGWTTDDNCILYDDTKFYTLKTSEIQNRYNQYLMEYYDDGESIIDWYWRSQHLHFGVINYKKQLKSTGFTFVDDDQYKDEYGLSYKFYVYDRLLNEEANDLDISGDIMTVAARTERTFIGRFNFLQLEINNIDDDLSKNKLELISIMLKFRTLGVSV